MPGRACWDWLEAYGCMEADPEKVHSADWTEAYTSVEKQLDQDLPRETLNRELERMREELDAAAPVRFAGSGWAALELLRRKEGDSFPGEKALFEPDSMGEDQAPWRQLLETGSFPAIEPEETPAAYLTQPEWTELLERAVKNGSDHWHAWYQLGVMYCAQGNGEKGRTAFQTSQNRTPNGWALRCLAVLDAEKGSGREAAKMLEAYRLLPILPLAIECGKTLLKAENFSGYVDFFDSLPLEMQRHGRLQAMRVQAAIELEEFDLALELLTRRNLEVSDMREGEILLSDLWVKLWMRRVAAREGVPQDDALRARVLKEYPVPERLDFRMKTE